jgi:epsilon-lactone hydrolase
VTDYAAGHDPALSPISPVFADLSGLPPLIIQAGTHDVLLDDAVRRRHVGAFAEMDALGLIVPDVRQMEPHGKSLKSRDTRSP